MKKLLLVLVVAALAVAAFLYFRTGKARTEEVASWLPAGTSVFEDMPDIHRTKQRWPATALAQILAEPQVQAFLEKPRATLPGHDETVRRKAQLQKIDPTQLFVALTDTNSGEKAMPKLVLGLSYAGSKEELDSLVGELRQAVQKAFPAGKSDVVPYGSGEIETFTVGGYTEGLAYRGHWLFLSSDLGVLKSTLDGCDGKPAPSTLSDTDDFKKCLSEMPADADNLLYVQPKLMANSFASLMMMLQPEGDNHQMEALGKMGSYAVATKLDGELVRESGFIMQTASNMVPLASNALKLTTPDTVIFADGASQGTPALSQAQAQMAPLMPMLAPYLKVFQDQGLTLEQFKQAFGPESSFLLDWSGATPVPAPLVALDVRDATKAKAFLDALTKMPADGAVHFTSQEIGGVPFYMMPSTSLGFFPLQVSLALTDKFLVAGLSTSVVGDAIKRASGPGALGSSAAYQQAMALVQAPTIGYGYVDTKAVFEHIYNLVRGVASMGMIPHSGDFADMGKLPETAVISHHLTPLVSSKAVKDNGTLVESAGPVSPMQAGFFAGILGGVAGVEYSRVFAHGAASHAASPRFSPAPPSPAASAASPAPIPQASPSTSPSGTSL